LKARPAPTSTLVLVRGDPFWHRAWRSHDPGDLLLCEYLGDRVCDLQALECQSTVHRFVRASFTLFAATLDRSLP
jgi:hypothetical protein